MNSDLEGIGVAITQAEDITKIDMEELILLRRENTDLLEMVGSLKQKLHAKTVEFNRANKKLQSYIKEPPIEEQGTLLDQFIKSEP